MNSLIKFLSDKLIESLALAISIINLYLYYRTIRKEKVKLLIEQDSDEAYCFSFAWYQRYNCLFFHINISNSSKSDTSISKITLTDKEGNSYMPSQYNINDRFNDNGITLLFKNNSNEGLKFNLKSENLLKSLRIQSYGNINGFLVFFDVPIIKEKETYTLNIYTPSKNFKKDIIISPLPNNLKPINE